MDRRDFLKASAVAMLPVVLPAAMVKPAVAPVMTPESTLFPTGIRPLDEALGGGFPAGIALVLGHPGSGKTAFLDRLGRFPFGFAQPAQVHVVPHKEPRVCPLTGIKHYLPSHLKATWTNRPISLIDDMVEVACYAIDLRRQLFLDFFHRTSYTNTLENRLAVITWQTNRSAIWNQGPDAGSRPGEVRSVIVGDRPHFSGYYSNTIIRVVKLDYRGRGIIRVIKNRQTDFQGELTI